MFIGTAGQGEFSDRWGRKTIYQFNLLLFGVVHDPRRAGPDRHAGSWLPLHRGDRPRRRAAARLRLCRRIFAQAHPRPHPGDRALHRRRLRVADRLRCSRLAFRDSDRLARRLDRDRHRRAHRLGVPLLAAGIAALSGDARQRQGSARRARAHGHCRAEGAAHDRCRERHQERSVRRRVHDVPEARHRRHDLLHRRSSASPSGSAPGCPTS